MDVPQERGAIIFAQGRPIGRSIVPTAVACICRSCVWTCETRVKLPPLSSPSPSPSPPPPPPNVHVRCPGEGEIHARTAYSSSPTIPYAVFLSFFLRTSLSVSLHALHPPIVARRCNSCSPARSINNNGERESPPTHEGRKWKVLRCDKSE